MARNIDELVKALKNPDARVRFQAAWALAGIGPTAAAAAVPALIEALRDTDEDVRYRAALTLGTIGPVAKAAVPALIEVLGDPDEVVVRHAAARALQAIRGPRDNAT